MSKIINISVELADREYLAIKKHAAKINGMMGKDAAHLGVDLGVWTVDDEVQLICQDAVRIKIKELYTEQKLTDKKTVSNEGDAETTADIREEKSDPLCGYTEEEITLMARVVQAEYGNGTEHDKRLIVATILNRVETDGFPSTVIDVIVQPHQFARAPWASEEAYDAVYKEIAERTDGRVLWFCSTGYLPYGTPLYKENGHYFSGKE